MFPPLPPPMPPWPNGKPPWEQKPQASAQQQQQQQQAQQQAAQQQARPPMNLRPQVIHGLVPPSMIYPTVPMWVTPQPYFRPTAPARPPQQPAPQTQQQAQQQPKQTQQATEQQQVGRMNVARTEEQPDEPQPFRPVMPVAAPGLPMGARHRHYWTRS